MTGLLDISGIFLFLAFPIGLILLLVYVIRRPGSISKSEHEFEKIAQQLDLTVSGVSNNPDYNFLYDSFSLSGEDGLWQTTTPPLVYINPYRRHAAELAVKGNYNMPWIRLEAKRNKIRIPHRSAKEPTMTEVQLEGNFSQYFTLSCEAGHEVIALQVVNPQVMERTIADQQYFDIEIHGSSILITTDCKTWSVEFVQKLLAHVTTLDTLARTTQRVTKVRSD